MENSASQSQVRVGSSSGSGGGGGDVVDEPRVSVDGRVQPEGRVGGLVVEGLDRGNDLRAVNGGPKAVGGGAVINASRGVVDLGLNLDQNLGKALMEPSIKRDVWGKSVGFRNEENVSQLNEALPCALAPKSSQDVVTVKVLQAAEATKNDFDKDNADNKFDLNGNLELLSNKRVAFTEKQENVGEIEVELSALKSEDESQTEKESEDESRTEKETEFNVSDLVWGKVRSHPWWPGQIFDPSAASRKAKKYLKKNKDGYLIAYFGDQTFAWNEASHIKGFQTHFSQMEKQSSTDSFCHAVDCALKEVSRRVEFGLACSCLLEEVYSKIKTQVIANAGICEGSSRRDGGDNFSSADTFIPTELVHYLKILAQSPNGGIDNRFEFIRARSQLLAFYRWKGYYQLPEVQMLDGLVETEADVHVRVKEISSSEVVENHDILGRGELLIRGSSLKRKHISSDALYPSKKEKHMFELLSGCYSGRTNGENASAMKTSNPVSSNKKCKAAQSVSNNSMVESRNNHLLPETDNKMSSSPKKLGSPGKRMGWVAHHLVNSSPVTMDAEGRNGGKLKVSAAGNPTPVSRKSQRIKVIPLEYPPPDEMLLQLCLAAENPMKGHSCLFSLVRFFSDFRNSICLENSNPLAAKKSTAEVSGNQAVKMISNSEASEKSGFEGTEDSYWTDRIIQNSSKEQILFEPKNPIEKVSTAFQGEVDVNLSSKPDHERGTTVLNAESAANNPASLVHENGEYSPTALILNFADLDSIPSESNLNQIFSRWPLIESETKVLKKSKRAKVVFRRRSDAEIVFSTAVKYETFGPSLVSYRLTPSKTSVQSSKRRTKNTTSRALQ